MAHRGAGGNAGALTNKGGDDGAAAESDSPRLFYGAIVMTRTASILILFIVAGCGRNNDNSQTTAPGGELTTSDTGNISAGTDAGTTTSTIDPGASGDVTTGTSGPSGGSDANGTGLSGGTTMGDNTGAVTHQGNTGQ